MLNDFGKDAGSVELFEMCMCKGSENEGIPTHYPLSQGHGYKYGDAEDNVWDEDKVGANPEAPYVTTQCSPHITVWV